MDRPRFEILEARVDEQSKNWDRVWGEIAGLRVEMKDVRSDIKDVRGDIRDLRGELKDVRGEIKDVRAEIGGLRTELAMQFRWTIGIMMALVTGVLAAVLTR